MHRIVLLRISPGIITAALCPLFVPGLPREALPLSYGIRVGKDLAGKSVPFESRAQPARQRVLVKAESTGVCPNSSEPRDSVAGPSFRDDGFEALVTEVLRFARAVFMDAARQHGVQYVDLSSEKVRISSRRNRRSATLRVFRTPAGEGHGVWYRELLRQTDIHTVPGPGEEIGYFFSFSSGSPLTGGEKMSKMDA
jgi:hypothetical protein